MDSDAPYDELNVSQDAILVLALARNAIPFARTRTQEVERWLRVMRMHGQVGAALQGLGVGERPLEGPRDDEASLVTRRAMDFARQSGAECMGTVHVLFAVLEVYGWAFDQELSRRGTSRGEIFERLAAMPAGAPSNEAAA